ncbi:MAG: taurine dioxygenase [Balneola sp.]|nr:taurine dioxygenase [Balneola sp.]MBO6650760.1 taurine dioxygenase [Balneola sp.]MBO6710673.1 taurine dioxygenase [Balneola sp.]MBO6799359.1 taurine dioxygenase [Balneola sp.]MBO6869512.1 taurine dioxygenase [Balneola sp.]
MLYGDERYIKEFAEAAVISFSEFKTNYSKYLELRNEEAFRKAGHKIKPVAQMLGLNGILEEYEYAKTLLWEEKDDTDIHISISKMDKICSSVLNELENLFDDE